jgi:hypothetical protein
MLDITLCTGGDCTQKFDCYRFTAVYYGRQDFFGSVPYNKLLNNCEYIMNNNHQIQNIAYLIWIDEGRPNNCELEHWLKAKEKIKLGLR